MSESTIIETENKAAMEHAIHLAARATISGTEARILAARANLVSVLYRAMIGREIAKPEVIDALIKASE